MQRPATGEAQLFWKPNELAPAARVLLDSTQVPVNSPMGVPGKHRHPAPTLTCIHAQLRHARMHVHTHTLPVLPSNLTNRFNQSLPQGLELQFQTCNSPSLTFKEHSDRLNAAV